MPASIARLRIGALALALVVAAAVPLDAQQKPKRDPPKSSERSSRASVRRPSRPAVNRRPPRSSDHKPTIGRRAGSRPAVRSTVDRRRDNARFDRWRRGEIDRPARSRADGMVDRWRREGDRRLQDPVPAIERFLLDQDGRDRVRLLTPRSSDAQRASALAELRRLLADYEAHARHSEEPVDPRPDDRVTDDDGRARGGQGGGQVDEPADDGSEDDDSEDPVDGGSVPAPLPYSPGVRYGPFSWFDLLYDFQLSPCAELHPFDRSLRGRTLGWPRQSWHYRGLEYRSMSWAYNGANTAFDCLNNDRVYDWEQYREKLEGEVVSCAEVTAERSDGAAATFRVAMPALGARTLEGLEDAIDERLRSGVTVVDLPITLAPEEVEDVSVGECSEPATGP